VRRFQESKHFLIPSQGQQKEQTPASPDVQIAEKKPAEKNFEFLGMGLPTGNSKKGNEYFLAALPLNGLHWRDEVAKGNNCGCKDGMVDSQVGVSTIEILQRRGIAAGKSSSRVGNVIWDRHPVSIYGKPKKKGCGI